MLSSSFWKLHNLFYVIAATADVMDQENSVEHVANNSLRRRRNLHGDFQYCNGPSEYFNFKKNIKST